MTENRPLTKFFAHLIMILGVVAILFPLWFMFVTASHDASRVAYAPLPLLPGGHLWENLHNVFTQSIDKTPLWRLIFNSFVMAVGIATLKIIISLMSAYAIVYFKFPFRRTAFGLIFITLMLPVEVRIVPTFAVAANLNLINNYPGLILPLIASATATFLFRQTFLTIPEEMLEAARVDGAGPWRFFKDILLPLSRNNIAALFIILFIYGWNQYLWPLMVGTDPSMRTIVMSITGLLTVADEIPQWHIIMTIALLAMLPPILIIIVMQKHFVRGLTQTEK